jgi:hypothetical protein
VIDEPEGQESLPEADVKSIAKVAKRGALGACPACKQDSPRSLEAAFIGRHKVVLVICNNCGFVAQHAADFIDKIPVPHPDDG